MAARGVCAVEGCGKPIHLRQWCNAHYIRWRRHGDPEGGGPTLAARGEPARWMRERLGHNGRDCLFWPFGRTGSGYGVIYDGAGQERTHRWVCEKVHGAPPSALHEAAHTCGNGHLGCVSGGHLYWATGIENAADRDQHGRTSRGETHVTAKLTNEAVLAIYRLRGGQTYEATAAQFGTSKGAVADILNGRSWTWLTGAKPDDRYRTRRRAQRLGGGG